MVRTLSLEKMPRTQFSGGWDRGRSGTPAPLLPGHPLLRLQQAVGNQAVGRLIQRCQDGFLCGPCAGGECTHHSTNEVTGLLQRKGSGQPLDAETRHFMQSRFAYDFSGVRVHTNVHADQAARSLNALAFTVGQDVFFGAGHYRPQSQAGKRLLAHELAHVVQQRGIGVDPRATLTVNDPGDSFEREAEATAESVLLGKTMAVRRWVPSGQAGTRPRIQRRVHILSDPLPPGVFGPPSRRGATFIEAALEEFTDLNLSFDGEFLAVDEPTRRAVLRERRERPTSEAVRARLFIIPGVSREKASAALKLAQIIMDTRATAVIQPVFGEAPVFIGAFPAAGGGGIQRIDIEDLQRWQMLTEPSMEPVLRILAFLRNLLGRATAARPAAPLRTDTPGSHIYHEIVESFRAALAGPGTAFPGPHRRAIETANVALRAMGHLEFLPCPSPATPAPGGEIRIRTFWRRRRGASREDRFRQDWFLSAPPDQILTWVDPPVLHAASVATGSACPP